MEITRTDKASAEYIDHLETIIGLLRKQVSTAESLHKLQTGQSNKTLVKVFSVLTGSRHRRGEVAHPSIRILGAQKQILSHLRSTGDPGVNLTALEEEHRYLEEREGYHRIVSALQQDQDTWWTRGGSSDSEVASSTGCLKPAIKARADSVQNSGQTEDSQRKVRWVPDLCQ